MENMWQTENPTKSNFYQPKKALKSLKGTKHEQKQ